MKKLSKFLSILLCLSMLIGFLPSIAKAAETTEELAIIANTGVLASDSLSISWASTNFTFTNEKNSSNTAIRTSDSDHFRVYAGNKTTIAALNGKMITKIVITCTAANYASALAAATLSAGAVTIESATVTFTFASAVESLVISDATQWRLSKVVVTFADDSDGTSCTHEYDNCEDTTCNLCGTERTPVKHTYDNCADTDCNTCSATREALEHQYTNEYDASCNNCTSTREVVLPTADTVLTIPVANAIGVAQTSYTTGKYYVTGVITEVYNTTYGNMYITDEDGNTLTVYGTYSADGSTRYDSLNVKPIAGDTVTVYGVIGQYNGTAQMMNGWITEHTSKPCDHTSTTLSYVSDTTHGLVCDNCGQSTQTSAHSFANGNCECGYYEYVTNPEVGVAYKLGLYQGKKATYLYPTGEMDGYYLAASATVAESINVYLAEATGGYYLYCIVDGAAKYIDIYVNGTYVNIGFKDAPTAVYRWDSDFNTFVTTITNADGEQLDYYMGTYSSYETLSASKYSYIETSFPAHLYAVTKDNCKHSWTAADCTNAKTCADCGATDGDALGHTPGAAASCTTAQTCTVCGCELKSALGHTPGAAATCTANQTCTTCGTVITPKAGHSDSDSDYTCDICLAELCTVHDYTSEVIAPTCTEAGMTVHTCTICGDSYIDAPVAALGHDMSNATCTTAPVCQRNGCSHTEGTALGHSYDDGKVTTSPTCTATGVKTFTCKNDATHTYTETVKATGHSLKKVEAKAATTESTGLKEHYKCDTCGKLFSDANGNTEITLADVTIDKLTESVTTSVTITFDDTAKRTVFTEEKQVWTENGITVTNEKAESTSNIADYSKPVRFYKNSVVTVAYTGIKTITFNCSSASYATALVNALTGTDYTVISDGQLVTVTLNTAADTFSVTLSAGQVRVESIEINRSASTDNDTTTPDDNTGDNSNTDNNTGDNNNSDSNTGDSTDNNTSGETVTQVATITLVSAPKAGVAYKLGIEQSTVNKNLYFIGTTANTDYYLSTSTDTLAGVDVYVEEVTGGYQLYFYDGQTKTYIDIYLNGTYVNLRLTTDPTAVYKWDTEYNTFVTTITNADGEQLDYYMGTYSSYETLSASKYSYIETSFPAHLYTITTVEVEIPKTDGGEDDEDTTGGSDSTDSTTNTVTLDIPAMNLENAAAFEGKTVAPITFTAAAGEESRNAPAYYVKGTAARFYAGNSFTISAAEGYKIVSITINGDGSYAISNDNCSLTNATATGLGTATVVLTPVDGTADIVLTNIAESGNFRIITVDVVYESISGSNSDIDSTEPSKPTVTVKVANKVTNPTTGNAYKLGYYQANLDQTLYFTGEMNGYYLATSSDLNDAVDIYLESVDGGLRIYFMDGKTKTYIDVVPREDSEGKVNVILTTSPSCVYTYDAQRNTFVTTVEGNDWYLGTYSNYSTISASKTSYIEDTSTIGVSQFPVCCYTVKEVAKTGDSISIFVALMAVSALGIAVIGLKKKEF